MDTRKSLKQYLNGKGQFYKVNTDRMQNRGIQKGDVIVVDPENTPAPGELGLELTDQGKKVIQEASQERKWWGKVVMVVKEV